MAYKKLFNISLIALFFAVFMFSCKKTAQQEVNFTPEIENVYPIYASNGEEISILFKGASINNISKINIKINDVDFVGQYSGYHNVIKFKIPNDFFNATKVALSLQISINGKTSKKLENAVFSSYYPKLDRFLPDIAGFGDEVTIYGYNFMPDTNKTSVSFFDKNNSSVKGTISYINSEVIKVKVPQKAETNIIAIITGTNDPNYRIVPLLFTKTIRVLNQ